MALLNLFSHTPFAAADAGAAQDMASGHVDDWRTFLPQALYDVSDVAQKTGLSATYVRQSWLNSLLSAVVVVADQPKFTGEAVNRWISGGCQAGPPAAAATSRPSRVAQPARGGRADVPAYAATSAGPVSAFADVSAAWEQALAQEQARNPTASRAAVVSNVVREFPALHVAYVQGYNLKHRQQQRRDSAPINELVEHAQQLARPTITATPPSVPGAGNDARAFEAAVESNLAAGLPKAKAIAKAVKEHPQAHRAFVERANQGRQRPAGVNERGF